jgi:methionyl-tRNA synthetase
MKIYKTNVSTGKSYGMDVFSLPIDTEKFGGTVCTLLPGKKSVSHNHFESEFFFFFSGGVSVYSNSEKMKIDEGDIVEFAPFDEHIIENESTSESVQFLALYWPPKETARDQKTISERRQLIFSTPPTPNGDLHLGHLSGPYLAGDMLRRSLISTGVSAMHLTGRDDNQTYTAVKADAEATTPPEIASLYAGKIVETLSRANVPLDGFIAPDRDGKYASFVQGMIEKLYQKGYIYSRVEPMAVGQDGTYLHEGYVRGLCPYCKEESDGNACEACGRPNQCIDLIDPIDRRTGKSVDTKNVERLYFRFSLFSDYLFDYIRSAKMPAKVFALSQTMLHAGLPDICVSYPSSWGLPISINGFQSHITYVWFEMAAGYLYGAATTIYPQLDVWEGARRVYSAETDVVHCYGFDNSYYHSLLFPAIYRALELDLVPPSAHIVNELLDLDGKKFSTSRNHLIWGRKLLECVPADSVRLGLALARPQAQRSNFSLEKFVQDVNQFWKILGELIAVAKELYQKFGRVPEPGAWLQDHQSYFDRIKSFDDSLNGSLSISNFAPQEAAREIIAFLSDSLRFVKGQSTLLDTSQDILGNYQRTSYALMLLGLRSFAHRCAPILPDLSLHLSQALGMQNESFSGTEFLKRDALLNWSKVAVAEEIDFEYVRNRV